jgi:hypothetical protein
MRSDTILPNIHGQATSVWHRKNAASPEENTKIGFFDSWFASNIPLLGPHGVSLWLAQRYLFK